MATYDPLADYNRVGKIAPKLAPENIDVYTPNPSQRERAFGEILRYFVRFVTHKSPADIFEVSKTTYSRLSNNKLYKTISIRWRISGKLDDEYVKPNSTERFSIPEGLTIDPSYVRLYTGVVTANKLSVELADEDMPGIKNYLTNYIRFWKF